MVILFPVYTQIILYISFLEWIGNCSRPDQFLVARATSAGFLEHGTYPAVFMKSQIFVLQRSCKNYKLVKGKLYCKEQVQDGTDRNRHVVKRSKTVFLIVTSLQEDTVESILP